MKKKYKLHLVLVMKGILNTLCCYAKKRENQDLKNSTKLHETSHTPNGDNGEHYRYKRYR